MADMYLVEVSLPRRFHAQQLYLDSYKSLSSRCLMCLELYDEGIMKMKKEQYCSSQCCREDVKLLDAKGERFYRQTIRQHSSGDRKDHEIDQDQGLSCLLFIFFLLPFGLCSNRVRTHINSSATRKEERHESSDEGLRCSENHIALHAQALCTVLYSKCGQKESSCFISCFAQYFPWLLRKPIQLPVNALIDGEAIKVHTDGLKILESAYKQEDNKEVNHEVNKEHYNQPDTRYKQNKNGKDGDGKLINNLLESEITLTDGEAEDKQNEVDLTEQKMTCRWQESRDGDRHGSGPLNIDTPATVDAAKTKVSNDLLTDNTTTYRQENNEQGGGFMVLSVPNILDKMKGIEMAALDFSNRKKRHVLSSLVKGRDTHLLETLKTVMEERNSEMSVDIPTDSADEEKRSTDLFQDLKHLKQDRRTVRDALSTNGIQKQPRRIKSTENYEIRFSRSACPVESEDVLALDTPASESNVVGISTQDSISLKKVDINLKRLNFHMICVTHPSERTNRFKAKERSKLFQQHNDLQIFQYLNPYDKKDKTEKTMEKDEFVAVRNVTWLPHHRLPVPKIELTVALLTGEVRDILDRIAAGEKIGAQESMKYEILRICTFRNYPSENKPFRIQLASAGLYYASEGDEVDCYVCGLRKSGWTESDKPVEIHKQIKRSCEFLVRNDRVNVPIPDLPLEHQSKFSALEALVSSTYALRVEQNQRTEEASGSYGNFDANTSTSLPHRVFTPPPKHPQYAILSVRLETFKSWPTNIPQTAQIMAECGYYYAGFGDCVRCFHCGIGLRHWTEDDYPWIEHARWSRDCAYLRQMKGEEFIQRVHLAIDQEDEAEDLLTETPKGQPADVSQVTPNEDINQVLLTDPAQSVLEIGYSPNTIKKAIGMVLRSEEGSEFKHAAVTTIAKATKSASPEPLGRSGITAQKILEKVFMLEENAIDLPQEVANMAISSEASNEAQLPETSDKERNETKKNVPKSDAVQEPQSSSSRRNSEASRTNNLSTNDPHRDTTNIIAENRKLKEQTICKVCLDKPVSIVFLPCGHLVTCANCAPAMRKCPICRAFVKGCVKTFMS